MFDVEHQEIEKTGEFQCSFRFAHTILILSNYVAKYPVDQTMLKKCTQFGEHMFSICVSCSFALLVGHDVYFLQTQISCCRVVLQSEVVFAVVY